MRGEKEMNLENIREIRTVTGEETINTLLETGKWKVLNLSYDGEQPAAVLVRIRA